MQGINHQRTPLDTVNHGVPPITSLPSFLPSLSSSHVPRPAHRITQVLDVGTGGGLPGLPLAIYYPDVKFTLIDGKGKKIAAVHDMVNRLGLRNVRTFHARAEDVSAMYKPFDCAVLWSFSGKSICVTANVFHLMLLHFSQQ